MVDPIDELPHASDDPAYCETWAYSFTDPERRATALVHASWLPGRGVGNHLVHLHADGRSEVRRVETRDPLHSSLLSLELEPWREARVRCKELDLELHFEAFTPPIDFGELFQLGDAMHQRHVQAGVRASGSIGGASLSRAPGWRDRSWGPRNLRRIGRLVALFMSGCERDLFFSVNTITGCERPFSAAPDTSLGCSAIDGEVRVFSQPPSVLRNQDGTPACIELPGGSKLDLDLSRAFCEDRFLADRGSAAESFPTAEPLLVFRFWSLAAHARGLGPVAGSYQEAVLFTH